MFYYYSLLPSITHAVDYFPTTFGLSPPLSVTRLLPSSLSLLETSTMSVLLPALYQLLLSSLPQRRYMGVDDEVALVDGVFLNDESLTQISRLFKACYGEVCSTETVYASRSLLLYEVKGSNCQGLV